MVLNNTKTRAALALLCATSTLAQAQTLDRIETRKVGEHLQIHILGEGLSQPKEIRVNNGASYILEFEGGLSGRAQWHRVRQAGVSYVQSVWFSARPPRVRVHVRMDPSLRPFVEETERGWLVRFDGDTESVGTRRQSPAEQDRLKMEAAKEMLGVVEPAPVRVRPVRTPARPAQQTAQPEPVAPRPAVRPDRAQRVMEQVEAFPETVPPITPVRAPAARASAPAVAPAVAPGSTRSVVPARPAPRVSLSVDQTDVVQIVRALAAQSGANIVLAPDVSPEREPRRLTMTLNQVTVDEALTFVTAMADLRYAKVGTTFVVTRTENFASAMRVIMERSGERVETRVIGLTSGEGAQIKQATLRAMPPDGSHGFYELLVPGESMAPLAPGLPSLPVGVPAGLTGTLLPGFELQSTGQQSGAQGSQPPAGQSANGVAPPAGQGPVMEQAAPTRAHYVILVGERSRLDDVEAYVRQLDTKITRSFSLQGVENVGTAVVTVESGETARIKSMLERLIQDNPRRSEFSITETSLRELPEGEESTKLLLMLGPEEELKHLERFAVALDRELCAAVGIEYAKTPEDRERIYEVVALRFIEPKLAEFDLKSRVRGLHVTVLPDAVTPGLTGEAEDQKLDSPQDQAAQGRPQQDTAEQTRAIGREPMKLLMRGTRSQIQQAREYLAKVDVAPKQVAFELRVMDLTREDAQKFGLDWSVLTGGRLTQFRMNQNPGGTAAQGGAFQGEYRFRGSDTVSWLGILDQMNDGRRLIARPNMLATDARPTTIFVGDTVRYVSSIQSTQTGVTVVTDEVNVGVQFDLVARVGADGHLAVNLRQSLSILNSFTPVPGGGSLPQTSDRSSTMHVNMRDGETIAIGGLIREEDRRSHSGIPFLKDLPIIGKLFGRTDTTKQRTEIVFFLTAVVVDQETRPDAASPRTGLAREPDPLGRYLGGPEQRRD